MSFKTPFANLLNGLVSGNNLIDIPLLNKKNAAQQISKFTDYTSPTGLTKLNEAAKKVSASGEVTKFGNLSNGIKLGANGQGDVVALDKFTGEQLSKTLANVKNPLPFNSASSKQPPDGQAKTQEQRVKLTQYPSVGSRQTVEFMVMPTIQESRDIQYKQTDIVHHPGEMMKYISTSSRSWNITAKLISRNVQEATTNLESLNMIRSWAMPFYGTGTGNDSALNKFLGAPPPILMLQAYGPTMIGKTPTIMTNYSWTFPNDCDYIPTNDGTPFPVIIDVTISLKESYSPSEFSSFDLAAFKEGDLTKSFSGGGVYSNKPETPSAATPSIAGLQKSVQEKASSLQKFNPEKALNANTNIAKQNAASALAKSVKKMRGQ